MKLIAVLFSFLCGLQATAQSFEYFQDQGYRNVYSNILNVGDTMWVVTGYFSDQYYTTAYIAAFDTTGDQKWNYTAPNNSEVQRYSDLHQLPDGRIAVLGMEQFCCDCTTPYTRLSIFSPEGEILEDFSYPEFDSGKPMMALNGEIFLLNGSHQYMPTLFAVDTAGEFLWGVEYEGGNLSHVQSWRDGYLAFYQDHAVYIDTAGTVLDSLVYEAPPKDVALYSEYLWLLYEDGIYTVSDSLDLDLMQATSHASRAERMVTGNNGIYLWNDSTLVGFDEQCQLTDSVSYLPTEHFETGDVALNGVQCVIAGARYFEDSPPDFQIYRGATIKGVPLAGQYEPQFPDVSLDHFELSNIEIIVVDEALGLFGITGVMGGYVINSGDEIVDAVNVTEFHSQGICGLDVTRESMENLNLLPGDSIYITQNVGPLNYGDMEQQLFGKVCLFVSGPNHMHDRDESNDFSCVAFDLVLDVPELNAFASVFPNPANDQVHFRLSDQVTSGQLQIVNSTGKVVLNHSVQQNHRINVSTWPAGIYFARLINDGAISETIRFSVVH